MTKRKTNIWQRDRIRPVARAGFKWGAAMRYDEPKAAMPVTGDVFLEMRDARTGELLHKWEKRNVITFDAGILAARLFKDPLEPPHGINMLALGTGGLGALLNPDAPSKEQRRLNNEISRKPFSTTSFRDANGAAVALPTNVVDFTATFDEAEAVGALNEMGLMSTISDNVGITNLNTNAAGQGGQAYDPSVDVTQFDMLVNHLTFGVITKPATAILTITWRLTFG